ncbi:bifunctional hydroxymethylpyrimidine kinase/phosphomethylpyrimidine kinase [Enterococcus sp. CWB-B31]|uniref:bifunctional hydroxymethylpyrimidine kinase/phosphomethylpyrimidine kinase n=1 Tax=Enterococcus sp. CWB-B31 TaxID=2885159 RepID=UPI001E475235|nr:bifunctional hydroxymethylpyrimidine kinase/phosphomethylpyrimidine kinase [Enterococcus sp. CWB-B31]MCB5956305.1 bifunctional hydroxymethylpyrimidine kinase/phosphomethylpyrimidine kinase [Enterococcus sp. CWB-B31]
MNKTIQALTIAGFDSGGGAGMQADLKTFQERFVFGTSALTALPIQNTQGVKAVYDISTAAIIDQLNVIQEDFSIDAVKTGMLFTEEIIRCVAQFLQIADFGPLVIDPVMIAKGGHALLKEDAVQALIELLLPLAEIITPNIPEAEAISKMTITSQEDMAAAGKLIQSLGAKNVVVKGGHHLADKESSDMLLLSSGKIEWLTAERIDTKNTHGTGCTFSACITAELAKGKSVEEAVRIGKAFIQAAITDGIDVGKGNGPTNHWAYRKVKINEEK